MANNIIGVKEVQDLLKAVDKVTSGVLTKSAKAGAKIVKDEAKSNAPEDKGNLKKSIKLKAEKRKKGKRVYDIGFYGEGLVKISKEGKRSFYPASQEYGWVDENGKRHEGKRFLRNAADHKRNEANQTVLSTMAVELDKLK